MIIIVSDLGVAPIQVAPLDPDIQRLLAQAPPHPPMWEQLIADVRARVSTGDVLCATGPTPHEIFDDHVTSRDGQPIGIRRYAPRRPYATVVYAHGGGWISGDLAYADETCRRLAVDAKALVVSVDYRRAPEHRYPIPLNDVEDVVRHVIEAAGPRPLVLAGDSAGGNLAAAAARRLRGVAPVDGQLLIYPALDHRLNWPSYGDPERGSVLTAPAMAWFWNQYLPDAESRRDPDASPLRDDRPDLTPATVIVVAGHDPLHDEGRAYARRLRESGVEVTELLEPSLPHGFWRFTAVSEGATAAAERAVTATRDLIASQTGSIIPPGRSPSPAPRPPT